MYSGILEIGEISQGTTPVTVASGKHVHNKTEAMMKLMIQENLNVVLLTWQVSQLSPSYLSLHVQTPDTGSQLLSTDPAS